MAEDADRDATRLRLITMATDYEARAKIAEDLVKPIVADPSLAQIEKETGAPAEPNVAKAPKIEPGRKNARGLRDRLGLAPANPSPRIE